MCMLINVQLDHVWVHRHIDYTFSRTKVLLPSFHMSSITKSQHSQLCMQVIMCFFSPLSMGWRTNHRPIPELRFIDHLESCFNERQTIIYRSNCVILTIHSYYMFSTQTELLFTQTCILNIPRSPSKLISILTTRSYDIFSTWIELRMFHSHVYTQCWLTHQN
jgi:hypothetical protein